MSDNLLTVPLFPINLSILPYESVPLHIFEERYKEMVSKSLKEKNKFGIIYKENDELKDIGCLVSISKVYKKYKDGKYDILVEGERRFRTINLFKKNDLCMAEVEILDELYEEVSHDQFAKVLDKYLKLLLTFNINHDIQNEINKKISFDFTRNILIPNSIKQEFLELDNELERIIFIDQFLDSILIKSRKEKNKLFKGNLFN